MKKIFFLSFLIFIGLVFLSSPNSPAVHIAFAQENALRVTSMPQFPKPFDEVTIDIENFSRDLNSINISWSVDGEVVQSGVGLKRLRTSAGALGSVKTVSINMGGDIVRYTIRPTVTDILWQADTYTPPFYKGKALHSNQDTITVVAEPFFITNQGNRLNPETLIYKWKKNGTLDDKASGYGKKSYRVNPSVLMKPVSIEVEVMTADNTYHSLSSTLIANTDTEVLLYENRPLYGIAFEKALDSERGQELFVPTTEEEIRVVGMPLYFSNEQIGFDRLSFAWSLNGTNVNQPSSEVIFRKPEGSTGGRSRVGLNIKNIEQYTQDAEKDFYIRFESESANSQTSSSGF